jgi:hypothetical protein
MVEEQKPGWIQKNTLALTGSKKHDFGVWTSSEGHVYEGGYKNGLRHGFRVMIFPSG